MKISHENGPENDDASFRRETAVKHGLNENARWEEIFSSANGEMVSFYRRRLLSLLLGLDHVPEWPALNQHVRNADRGKILADLGLEDPASREEKQDPFSEILGINPQYPLMQLALYKYSDRSKPPTATLLP